MVRHVFIKISSLSTIHEKDLLYKRLLWPKYSPSNKRAQRALGRSPEEKVKGHSGANNREPQGHNLNNFGRGSIDDVIYEI